MGKQRRQFSAAFKAKVALEAIKGQRTVQEIAGTFKVHPNQVTQWKRQALEQLPEVFSDGRQRSERADEELREELYKQIGRLQMELEWLKKKSGLSH
jgi:transposase-like protein